MKIFKENPLLLVWLVALTAIGIYSFFNVRMNVAVKLHLPDGVTVEKVETTKSLPTG